MFLRAALPLLLCGLANGFTIDTRTCRPGVQSRTPFMVSTRYNDRDFDISDVLAEADDALKAAQLSYHSKKDLTQEEKQEILASGIGGIGLGLILGMTALMQMPDIEVAVEPSIVPSLFAAACSAAAVSASSSDGLLGKVTRAVLGKTTQNIGNLIKESFDGAFASMVSSVKSKVDQTSLQVTEDVKAAPSNFVQATTLQIKDLFRSRNVPATDNIKAAPTALESKDIGNDEDDTVSKQRFFSLSREDKKAAKRMTSIRPRPPTLPPPLRLL